MTRNALFAAAALATLGITTVAPTTANAAISTLGECYNAVITYCNEHYPENASGCAGAPGGGLDQCDEEFGAAMHVPGFGGFQVEAEPGRPGRTPIFRLKMIRRAIVEQGPLGGEDQGREERTSR